MVFEMIESSSQLDDDRLANLRYARKVYSHDLCDLLHRELLAIVERKDELLSLRELSNGLRQMRFPFAFETQVKRIGIVQARRGFNHIQRFGAIGR